MAYVLELSRGGAKGPEMSRRLRIFPLPGVVLLPGTLLPLHIFEPRYRAMVADALEQGSDDRHVDAQAGLAEGRSPVRRSTRSAAQERSSSPRSCPTAATTSCSRDAFVIECSRRRRPDPYRVARVEEIASVPLPSPEEEARVTRMAARLFGAVADQMELPPLPEEPLSGGETLFRNRGAAPLLGRGAPGDSRDRSGRWPLRQLDRPDARMAATHSVPGALSAERAGCDEELASRVQSSKCEVRS